MPLQTRRSFLTTASASLAAIALAQVPLGSLMPARAAPAALAPTRSMRGGANNYRPGAPLVERLGSGFTVHGKVLRSADGRPLAGRRIQIWAATTLGGEREPKNHGSVLTRADGSFALEMEQIVPNFGQPHAHLAYDDDEFETVFLRPVMSSPADTSVSADFILA